MTKQQDSQMNFAFERSLTVTADEAQLPELLCSSPFFKPILDRKSADTRGFDDTDGESYLFDIFEMIRFGPGLDTYDFETLAAVYQIINTKVGMPKSVFQSMEKVLVEGEHRRLPNFDDIDLGVQQEPISGTITTQFRFDITTATAINRYLNRDVGSKSLQACRDSITRLSRNHFDLVNHESGRRDVRVPFFRMQQNKRGAYLIVFPHQMEMLFKVLLDFDLKAFSELPSVGQAMMLWMSTTHGEQSMLLDDARQRTNYQRPLAEFKRDCVTGRPSKNIRPVLEIMQELDFIDAWEITGTGRKTPFQLKYTRP